MSYCELLSMYEGEVHSEATYRNAHGWGAYIWDCLYRKYVGQGSWLVNTGRLWPLYEDARLSPEERLVLGSTYDNVVVRFADLNKLADAYDVFLQLHPIPENRVCHLPEMIVDLRKLATQTDEEIVGVAWYGMSVVENPWVSCNEDDEWVPYDIATGNKHWFLPFAL